MKECEKWLEKNGKAQLTNWKGHEGYCGFRKGWRAAFEHIQAKFGLSLIANDAIREELQEE